MSLSQQPNIGGDISQPRKVLNGNKPSETTDAYINMKTTNTPDKEKCCKIEKMALESNETAYE